jgi:hypothetical protein
MSLVKLDRRYNGYEYFSHKWEKYGYGEVARRQIILNFVDMREYMTRMNGHGCFEFEASWLKRAGKAVPEWGFNEQGNIFLRDGALVNFRLAMERWL